MTRVQNRVSLLLPVLSGLALTVWIGAAPAQEALLRGVDASVDTPAPRRRTTATPDVTPRDPVRALRGSGPKSTTVSSKIKGPKPQDIRPNKAVIAPTDPTAVAPGLAAPALRPRLKGTADDPFQPVGTRIGNIRVDLSNEVQAGYDDNTARSTGLQARRPSSFIRDGGELRLKSDWSEHEFSGEASAGYTKYPSAKEADRPDAQMRFGLRLDMARDTQIELETRGKIDTQQPNSPDLQVNPAERPLTYNYGASAGVTQRYNRLIIGLRGSVDRSSYDDVNLGNGASLDQSTRNLNDYAVRLRAGYELKPGLVPFVEGTVDVRQYDKTFDDTGFQRSSSGGSLKVGTSFEITRLVTGEVSAGYGSRGYDDARLADLRGPIADASIIWVATPLTTVTLRGASTFDETTLAGSSGSIARRVSLDLNHQLLRNLAFGANVALTDSRYDGIGRRDNVLTGTLRTEYRFDRTFSAKLSYTHERSLSNFTGTGYNSNIWMIGIKAAL